MTAVGSGLDGAILRIAGTFEVRGMWEKITSYGDAIVGSVSVVNEAVVAYNPFEELTVEQQSHSGAVATMTGDLIPRPMSVGRGTPNASRTGVTGKTFAQCRLLDSTANWRGFRRAIRWHPVQSSHSGTRLQAPPLPRQNH